MVAIKRKKPLKKADIPFTGRLQILYIKKFADKTTTLYQLSRKLWKRHDGDTPSELDKLISSLRAMAPKRERLVIKAEPAPREKWIEIKMANEKFASDNFMADFAENKQVLGDLKKISKLHRIMESETN